MGRQRTFPLLFEDVSADRAGVDGTALLVAGGVGMGGLLVFVVGIDVAFVCLKVLVSATGAEVACACGVLAVAVYGSALVAVLGGLCVIGQLGASADQTGVENEQILPAPFG